MTRRRKQDGFTLIELMIVIAIIGVLAFPEVEQVRTSAKLTGVQSNYRSVITTIYGLQSAEDIAIKLISVFGNSESPEIEDMTNPITGGTGVETALSLADGLPPAVYVFDGTLNAVPSDVERLEYQGAVVVLVLSNKNIEVFGCDEAGKVMTGLQRTIKL